MRLSALAAPRVIVQSAPPALSLLRQPTTSTSGMLRGSGRGASPMTSYSAAMQQQQRYVLFDILFFVLDKEGSI